MIHADQLAKIIALYNSGSNCHEIGRLIGCNHVTVWRNVTKHFGRARKVSVRLYSANDSYFDTIDTEEKAYVLGFMYADGSNDEKRTVVRLGITDLDILERIQLALAYSGPLYCSQRGGNKPLHILAIWSPRLSKNLAKLGCFQRKTWSVKFPSTHQVPTGLVRHFVRGLSDGDGCITGFGCRRQHIVAEVVGTKELCEGLSSVVFEHLGFSAFTYVARRGENHTTYTFRVCGRHQLTSYLNWLYADATIFLKRKHDKYEEFLSSMKAA